MARFFVLYLPDRHWQASLDVMRLLCDPEVRSPAHLTVRGPYANRPDEDRRWREVTDIEVAVVGVDAFLGPAQNTVFLRCESEELDVVWWKRSHKDGVPHITVYDGESRLLARKVAAVLSRYRWNFHFVADRLHEYVSAGRQRSLDLLWPEHQKVLISAVGLESTRDDLRRLSETRRLECLDVLASRFAAATAGATARPTRAALQVSAGSA